MAYNLGMTGFFKFEKTIAFLEKGDFESAANEMLNSKWANQVGKRAKELVTMIKIG
jgi:lysozyme